MNGFLAKEAEDLMKNRQSLNNNTESSKNEFADYMRNIGGKEINDVFKKNEKGRFGKFIDKLMFIIS